MDKQVTALNALITFGKDELILIKETKARGATQAEFNLFIYDCKSRGLNPLKNEIYFVKREVWDASKQAKVGVATHQVSIDGFRIIAQRSSQYRGQTKVEYGETVELEGRKVPEYAEIGVMREGFEEPVYARAYFAEYAQMFTNKKTGVTKLGAMWEKMPRHMLAKCAETLALRKAFPDYLSNLYTSEEMDSIDGEVVTETREDTKPEELGEAPVACMTCGEVVDAKTSKMSQKVLGEGKIFCSKHQTQIHDNPTETND